MRRMGLILALGWKAILAPVAFGAHAIVEDGQGRVLLVRHSYTRGWHLPGGGVKRGEPPADAVLRELKEEVGLLSSRPPEFLALYTRRFGPVSNIIALYRVRDATLAFVPNLEVREIVWADPAAPPDGTVRGALRRLRELKNNARPSPYW